MIESPHSYGIRLRLWSTSPDPRAIVPAEYGGLAGKGTATRPSRHTSGYGEASLGREAKDMIRQLLMGSAISICNIMVHALIMTAVVRASQATAAKAASRPNLQLIAVMIATVSVLMAAHLMEIIVWSFAYRLVDAAPANADTVYFAFVNYTTLGYGDIVPVETWQLLGPMTAMSGVLLFGWSTAVIFEVLRRTMARNPPALQIRSPQSD